MDVLHSSIIQAPLQFPELESLAMSLSQKHSTAQLMEVHCQNSEANLYPQQYA
jgi:hypothetical protein